MRRTFGVLSVVLGLLLVVGAGVVNWVVAPSLAQLPGDTLTTRLYAGHAASLVNPTFATDVPSGPGVLHNVNIGIRHTTAVVETRGSDALVSDRRVVTMPGYLVADLGYRYSVDRKSFQAGRSFPGVVPATGLTFNWPMSAKPHDYVGWVQDTMRTTPLRYVATVKHGGISTYEYRAQAADRVIRDRALGRMLPSTMSKADMLAMTPSLGLTHEQLLALDDLMKTLPDPVPLTYTYRFAATVWIAPASGIVVDMKQHEVRTTNIATGRKLVPVSPIMDMAYAFTPASVSGAVSDASSAEDRLRLVRTTLPSVALVSGIALLLVGAALLLGPRRRRTPPPPEEGPWVDELLEQRQPVLV
jgi:hypothetical protein